MRTSAKQRQRLVDDNVPFVRSIAAKIREGLPREIEFDELVGYGMQGLIEAAQRFDGRHGAAFTTFAYYRVRGAMFDGLRAMGWLPRGEYARVRFEARASAYLQHLAEREAGARALDPAAPARLEDEVRELADALGGVAAVYLAALPAPSSPTTAPESELEQRERAHTMTTALASLPDKERRLLELYYFEDRSLEEAGRALGLSKSWASRLLARAITLLREALKE
jgi:RNA polymerase sigma factor for flagellar operon FliA